MPNSISKDHLKALEQYLFTIYHPKDSSSISDINEARLKLFFRSTDPNLRPTVFSRKGLLEHTERSTLQAGWLWKKCQHEVIQPYPTNWDWVQESFLRYYP